MNDRDFTIRQYIEKRTQEGAPDNAIAVELDFFKKIKVPVTEVTNLREKMGISPRGGTTATAYMDSTIGGGVIEPSLPGDEIDFPVISTKEPEIAAAFQDASAKEADETIAPPPVTEPPKFDHLTFSPQAVSMKDLKTGAVFALSGKGAVKFIKTGSEVFSGYAVDVVVFEMMHGPDAGSSLKIPSKKIADSGYRKLTDEAFFEDLLKALENGLSRKIVLPKIAYNQQKFFDELLNDGNLLKIAKTLPAIYKLTEFYIAGRFADKAVHMLASEYAAVTGKDYKAAAGLFERAAGKRSQKQIDANYNNYSL